MGDSAHALVFEAKDKGSLEVAKAAVEYGPEAGAGVACAVLFARNNPAAVVVHTALDIYAKLLPGDHRIVDLRYWAGWAGEINPHRKVVWPVQPELKTRQQQGGFANVLMMEAARTFSDGTTSEKLVAGVLTDFLKKGMAKKRLEMSGK
jgi:hypothetical protein